jgi:DUF1009 family protein
MTVKTQDPALDRPVGLLAGWGQYPIRIANSLKERGSRVACIGYYDHADAGLQEICDYFCWLGPTKLGGAIRFFRRHGVRTATMAGKLHKIKLFERGRVVRNMPDWTCLRTFFHHLVTARRDFKDDTILTEVADLFSRKGIELKPATDFAPDLLVKEGQLSVRGPTWRQWKDIEFGWNLAREMGRLDVGQSVCVKGQAVLAVEAIEGTDECILRAGQLCESGEFTVVKVAKPDQDMRFDVPTIGLGTLRVMVQAGARLLAVEAGRTVIIDQAEVIDFANSNGLVLAALASPGAVQGENS